MHCTLLLQICIALSDPLPLDKVKMLLLFLQTSNVTLKSLQRLRTMIVQHIFIMQLLRYSDLLALLW